MSDAEGSSAERLDAEAIEHPQSDAERSDASSPAVKVRRMKKAGRPKKRSSGVRALMDDEAEEDSDEEDARAKQARPAAQGAGGDEDEDEDDEDEEGEEEYEKDFVVGEDEAEGGDASESDGARMYMLHRRCSACSCTMPCACARACLRLVRRVGQRGGVVQQQAPAQAPAPCDWHG